MGEHLIEGQFKSDKYDWSPAGFVPFKVTDPMAQDLLWQYAQRRRAIDPEFSADLKEALRLAGFVPSTRSGDAFFMRAAPDEPIFVLLGRDAVAPKLVREWADFRLRRLPNWGRDQPEERAQVDQATKVADDMQAYRQGLDQERNRKRIADEKRSAVHGEPT